MTLVFRSVRPLIKQRACIRVKQLNVMFSPRNWSVQYTSTSEAEDFKKLTNKDWEKKLSPEQYYVCREKGTEAPFTGKYYNHNEEGVYNCACCGTDLFSSVSKYDSGTGWPSFYEAVVENNEDNVLKRTDNTQGMTRTEVLCKTCNSHLGHVFDDGPPQSGLRFCVNSLALKFTPKKLKENKK